MAESYSAIGVSTEGNVLVVEIRRPPNNFFDRDMIGEISTACEKADSDPNVRVILLCAQGKNFCAGADFSRTAEDTEGGGPLRQHLYKEATRLYKTKKPIVAAIQGAAIGGGLGLALSADFRVCSPEARFSANFTRLGFHPGFGLTASLPRLIGAQQAALLFYTGRRVPGEEAVKLGLADMLVPLEEVRSAAMTLAQEIAHSAPLAIISTRETMRRGLVEQLEAATERELTEQTWLRKTEDFKEGVKAMAERRLPNFKGQ